MQVSLEAENAQNIEETSINFMDVGRNISQFKQINIIILFCIINLLTWKIVEVREKARFGCS